jgi:hypothetical protein
MFNVVLGIREEQLKIKQSLSLNYKSMKIFRGMGRVIALLMEVSDLIRITVALQPRPIRQGVG